jgi:type IV secretion system protein VirB2
MSNESIFTKEVIQTMTYKFERKRARAILLFLLLTPAAWAGGGGGGLPWETPLNRVATSLTGPVALSVSLIALMVAGGTLVFGGELSEFARRSCVAVLAIAFLVLGAGFMTALFGVGGATVL